MVRWLSPGVLAATALRVVLSGIFGAYSDKREIQAALAWSDPTDYTDRTEMWLDFVADLGDGFDATYTIASLLAEPELDVAAPDGTLLTTRRGAVLVMGGDEVYPTASTHAYENQLIGPYRAALPYTEADHPHVYAIPGNHDWYDGLTAFMRVFGQHQWIGGWQTQQTRSYFAMRLPQRWWLWGIDIQFDTYIDQPQLEYFERLAKTEFRDGDSVILCSAIPSWVDADAANPEAFSTLDYFERRIIRPHGASVLLALSGDSHHYAHYAQTGGNCHRITAGGGGAFLSATHHLPAHLELPPAASKDPGKTSPPARFDHVATFPSREVSRSLCRRIVSLPLRNVSFWVFVGVLHVLYAWMIQSSLRTGDQGFADVLRAVSFGQAWWGLVGSPLTLVLTVVLVRGLVGFAKDPARRWWLGGLHAAVQLTTIVVTLWAAAHLLRHLSRWPFLVLLLATVGVVGGLLGSLVMAAYLFLADKVGCNTNELFAAQRFEDYKNFLRLHLGDDGVLTVHPFGVTEAWHDWRADPRGAPEDPWLVPGGGGGPAAHLLEPPIRIDPRERRV
jgi:hypothetical protein